MMVAMVRCEIDVLTIKKEKLSSLLLDYWLCNGCQIVDRDYYRRVSGYPCPVCGKPGATGEMFFSLSVTLLINLMQEAFHSTALFPNHSSPFEKTANAHSVAVVLFFCSLREVLLNQFISDLCSAQKLPAPVYERLIQDNSTHNQRRTKLLPSLVGKKWEKIVKELAALSTMDYRDLDNFLEKVAIARNEFLHEGNKYVLPPEMARESLLHLVPLLQFYVDAHNRYVHPIYLQ